jgi:AcrR family transcriptional regulator
MPIGKNTGSAAAANGVGRPRSHSARKAVLESALKLIVRRPPTEVTIKAIAEDAKVGRQTIYRWWANRGDIVLEALLDIGAHRIGRGESQDLQESVVRFVRDTVKQANRVRMALMVVMVEAQLDPAFLERFRSDFIEVRRSAFLQLFDTERKRGGMGEHDLQYLADIVYGPLWYRLLVRHAPLDRSFADRLANSAIAWWQHRVDRTSS